MVGSRFAETLSTDCSLPLFVGHAKGRDGLCPIVKSTKRGHNLFLPKMRKISTRQLNHRNDNRKVCPIRKKTSIFLGRTAHFVYLCINNKLFETTANQGSSGNLNSNQFVTLFLFSILYLLIINELQRNLAFAS